MRRFLKRQLFYFIFLLIPAFSIAQVNKVDKPKPGDANYPIFPSKSDWAMVRHQQKLDSLKTGNYDLVLIGNSITQTMGEIGGKYESLKAIWNKYFAPYHALNLGYSGFRTENILWNLEHGELDFKQSPKLFILLIGTNNADSRNFPFAHTAEEIFAGTKAIVNLIREKHPTSKILILRIFPKGLDAQRIEATSPPIFSFPLSDLETAKQAGLLTKRLADDKHVFWLDVNQVFIRPDGKINVDLMPDLLHPNLAGAKAWVGAIAPTVANLMGDTLHANALTDNPDKAFCYLKKSTTVIGAPFQPDVTQVTYDGALYTRYTELCFSYGKKNTPLMAWQKTFYKGWIPVVEYDWNDENIAYHIEMFAASINERDASNTINFVKLTARNTGQESAEYHFTASLRGKLDDNRFGNLKGFSADNIYRMGENTAWRDSSLMLTFPVGGEKITYRKTPYVQPFSGKDFSIKEDTKVFSAVYGKDLQPGDSVTLVFKMPRVPVQVFENQFIKDIQAADYSDYRNKTIRYWENLLNKGTYYEIPEKKVTNSQKASMVHLILATRTLPDGHKTQTDGLPYPMFFLTSGPQMVLAYLYSGLNDFAQMIVDDAIKQQEADGLYFDRSLAHGGVIPAAHGQVMYAAAQYCLFTGDKAYVRSIFPSIEKAVNYIKNSIRNDQYGLLPPAYPYDNEMIDGHYTSTNLWTLMGLRYAIRLAQGIGEVNTANNWINLEKTYSANILKGIHSSVKVDGYVPTGLYKFLTGKKERRGFNEYQTNCDWENMLLAFPTECLSPEDPIVSGTLEHIRKGYAEGIMTYRHGQHLHQYITANMIEQYMVQGQSKQALIDFYHLLLHSGSTHEGFENLVKPWNDRLVNPECPPPHAWAAAKTSSLIRDFLIYEFGGKCGLQKGKRDLYLFSVLSPAWTKAGEQISVQNAPTETGTVSAKINFQDKRADLTIDAKFNTPPGHICFRIPYFKKLISVETNARKYSIENGCVVFSPDVTKAIFHWEEIPEQQRAIAEELLTAYRSTNLFAGVDSTGAPIIINQVPFLLPSEKTDQYVPLSFDLVKRTFLYEFDRRKSLNQKGK